MSREEQAIALLKRLQWSAQSEEEGFYKAWDMPPCCPTCGGLAPGHFCAPNYGDEEPPEFTPEGHAPNCELAILIGAERREED